MQIKKYKVTIFGETYTIVSDESEAQVLAAAQHVDSLMRDIAQRAESLDSRKIAVLTAFRIAHQMTQKEALLEAYNSHYSRLNSLVEDENLYSL